MFEKTLAGVTAGDSAGVYGCLSELSHTLYPVPEVPEDENDPAVPPVLAEKLDPGAMLPRGMLIGDAYGCTCAEGDDVEAEAADMMPPDVEICNGR